MSVLISAHQIQKSFGAKELFKQISFAIHSGDRIGLIGPNGAGKSTLLKILANLETVDAGTISTQKGLRVGYLPQQIDLPRDKTVLEILQQSLPDPDNWEELVYIDQILSVLELNADSIGHELSGGWQKRVGLAKELIRKPDLLLLDEPTNHLDIESVVWLEKYLNQVPFALVTITHDRVFLQKVSNRILELDRRNEFGLLSVPGGYQKYLETKQVMLEQSASIEEKLKNTLRRETEWLRRGAKARTTKQQARIHRAHDLSDKVDEVSGRNATFSIDIEFQEAKNSPKKLIEAKGISKSYNGRQVVPALDLMITPKTRLGLVGPNGSGKSTLIKLILGKVESDTGTVSRSDHFKPIYFEQHRESLDPYVTVMETLCPRGDQVIFQGRPLHIRSYLDRFKFHRDQAQLPVKNLSGGEKSRLLIAKLMLLESNCLILDEPTNDLDIETLDVLQEVLEEFDGAVILVTHDRYFLDQVSDVILGIGLNEKGQKECTSFVGIDQWQEWFTGQLKLKSKLSQSSPVKTEEKPKENVQRKTSLKKLSFNELRELETIEATIAEHEAKLEELTQQSQNSTALSGSVLSSSKLLEITKKMAETEKKIETLYARWQELEQRKQQGK